METKKNPSKDLERLSPALFKLGLAITLGVILLAFNFRTTNRGGIIIVPDIIERPLDELPPIILPPEQKPPPVQTQQIQVVDNTEKVEDDPLILIEIDHKTPVPDAITLIKVADEPTYTDNQVFIIVEEWPSFKGGEEARIRFLRDHIRYPSAAIGVGIHGTVYISFIVEKDGSISNVSLARGIGGGCDEEAIRVASLMPRWNPGKQRNRPVRTQFNMPIRFVLQ